MKVTILVDPSLVISTINSLFDLCLGVERKIFERNNVFSQNDFYGHALAKEPLPQVS